MKSGLKVTGDSAESIIAAIKEMAKKDVLVGIPEEDSDREDVPFGNAAIGYINENGSPAQNIPARPHLVPGVKSVQDKTIPELRSAALAVLSGDIAGAEVALNRAGTIAADGVKRFITTADFVPLADSTIAARARRGRKGASKELERRDAGGKIDAVNEASGQMVSNENARPLIDTGQYRRAITHVVRDKDANS
ncbi:hypothetical protein ACVQMG_000502 [Enterobacter roggenkampii]